MNVSEYIFDFFHKKGLDTVFMVTGGQAMWLNDAVGKHGGYHIVCTHHEQSAAMSADAYGRITNKPGIALVTAGPGSVNAMNGLVGGYTDSSPMIVISGQAALSFVQYQDKTRIRQYGIQGINIRPLVENVTKFFITVDDPQKIAYYLEKAYACATTGRPGPVWIDVPLDIQKMQVDESFLMHYKEETAADDSAAVVRQAARQAMSLLADAKRPVLLAGQGVSLSGARKEFLEFAEKARIPVITSRLGIDLIASDSDLFVGRPGNYGERSANTAIQNADLILSVGCRLASSLVGHNAKAFGKNAVKFVVDIDREELDKPGVPIDYKVCADCKAFLGKMTELLETSALPDYGEWIALCGRWKKDYPVVLPEYKDEKPVNSYYFTGVLSELASKDDMILVDTGSCFHVACQAWKVKKGQKFLTTGGLSSMGYWVAGIGACLANDRKNTIVVTGDGSLQMNIQEFATIRHNRLPIKVFIFNNNGYLLIRHTQKNFMEGRLVGESPSTGVWCPDMMEIAKAYGIKGISIDSAVGMEDKIREALAYDGPVICDVKTPEWQLLIPRVASDKLPDGTLVSREYDDMFPYLPQGEVERNKADAQAVRTR